MSEDKKRTDVFKEAGSSRVVASGSWTIMMAIIGAILLFVYTVVGGNYYGDSGALSYFSLTAAFIAIAAAPSAGFAHAFIKESKQAHTRSPEEGKKRSIQMSRINIIIGIGMSLIFLVGTIVFIAIDPVLFIILMGTTLTILIIYARDILADMMSAFNRFDMAAIIGGLYGVIVAVAGFVIIFFGIPPQALVFIPALMFLVMFIISLGFYNKIKTCSVKELLISSKECKLEPEYTKKYTNYGILTTISNLPTFGIFAHISLIMVYFTYSFIPMIFLGPGISVLNMTQLITLIDAFVFIEVAIFLFAGPLNVEIAEAHEKNDHETIEESVNAMGKIAFVLALPIAAAMAIFAPYLMRFFAFGSISQAGIIDNNLFVQGWMTFSLFSFGQTFYGLGTVFGAVLIGIGMAKKSALAYGIAAILILICTPLGILLFYGFSIFFPILTATHYSLIGAGVAQVIGGLFVLLYIIREIKKSITINWDLRIKNLMIVIALLSTFFILASLFMIPPFALLLTTTIGILDFGTWEMLSFIIFVLIGLGLNLFMLCFFGVFGKGEGKLVQGAADSFNMHWLGVFLRRIGRTFYNLNPKNDKIESEK